MAEDSSAYRADPGTPPLVALRGITKSFPGVLANDSVDIDLRAGEILALLGENGAGKSTLMNILTGIYRPDAGEILVDGYPQRFASPQDAIEAGIGMVHQHFKLVRAFTVAENVHLGWHDTPGMIGDAMLESRTAELARRFNLKVRPEARVDQLSTGEQQRVEILRVLSRRAKVLILDEPTAVLTPSEAHDLFEALRTFVALGNGVIFISHKLDEVLEISDRVTVLRGGRKIVTEATADCTETMLARLMVGREIVLTDLRSRPGGAGSGIGPTVMRVADVSAKDDAGDAALKNVSFDIRAGEILGIAGVAGNGQKELSQVLTGLRAKSSGSIAIGNVEIAHANSATFASLGVGHIPEDRLHSGLAPALSVAENAVLREYAKEPVSQHGRYRPREATALARSIAEAASVSVPDFGMPVRNLSGGNQQRLVARREMRIAAKVLIAAYPSRGLDVGAINTMMRYFVEMRDRGTAILFISEELEELLNLTDRIAVMFQGAIMGIVDSHAADIETIGRMMGGRKMDGRPIAAADVR